MLRRMASAFGRAVAVFGRVQRRRLKLLIWSLDLQQTLVLLWVRMTLGGFGLASAGLPFGRAAAGLLWAATELVAVEVGRHCYGTGESGDEEPGPLYVTLTTSRSEAQKGGSSVESELST